VLVENVDLNVRRGTADRYGLTLIAHWIEAVNHAAHGRFRRSILVDDLHLPAKTLVHLRRQLSRQRLTTDDQALDATTPVIQILDQRQMAGCEFEHIHQLVLHDALHRKGIGTVVDDQTIACEQRRED
jgi:hypothetical protein